MDEQRTVHRYGGVAVLAFSALFLSSAALPETYRLPLLPSASDPLRQGVVRIVNHSADAGDVAITAIDDSGYIFGPVTLTVEAQQAIHLSSTDFEQGNADKGLPTGVGAGQGDWRLVLETALDIEPLAYVQTSAGFVDRIHDLVPPTWFYHRVALVGPDSGGQHDGRLRLINPADTEANVVIFGLDEDGALVPGQVAFGLPAGTARTVTASDWRLRLQSDLDLDVLAYARAQNGFVTAVHDVAIEGDRRHHVPLFNPASETTQTSRLRLINPGDSPAEIVIRAWDDEGSAAPDGAVSLTLAAGASKSISAVDLEAGAEDLSGSLGTGEGKWRLSVQSDEAIQVMSLAESSHGHLTNLSTASSMPRFLNSCVGGPVDADGDGVSDHCDRNPDSALRALSGCADGSYIEDADGNPGLVGDCRVLIGIANLQVQSDKLPDDHVLRQWGNGEQAQIGSWDGITVSDGRITEIRIAGTHEKPGALTGFIPPELGRMTELTVLNLAHNELTGPVPAELGALSKLTQLSLNDNELTGAIPFELGRLANLTNLYLDDNALSGAIPAELGQLVNLTRLHLNNNGLSGAIPAELGNLVALRNLLLHANRLTGSIPVELGQLVNLANLYLHDNELSGPIPPALGQLVNMTWLALANNALSGAIPAELGNLTSLEGLNLNDNQFTGSIPEEFGNMGRLWRLDLGSNRLSGPIPSELGQLASVTEMYLAANELTGPIPAELGHLVGLVNLDIGYNELAGAIPAEFGRLTNLVNLHLGYNELTGPIPAELGNLTSLENLRIQRNRLSGAIPWVFWERIARGELHLDIWGNLISGFESPPQRASEPSFSTSPDDNGNASHRSVSYYQGPLTWSWNWEDEAAEHQKPILGRWAALAVRIDHEVADRPLVITRVLDSEDEVLAERLTEAAPPTTLSTGEGQWRTEYVFELPGSLYKTGNQIVHVIDPDNDLAETDEGDNTGESIVLYGEEPPPFRITFVPIHFPGGEIPTVDPVALMAAAWAMWPIADDIEVQVRAPYETDPVDALALMVEMIALWNAEADPDEFYHGVFRGARQARGDRQYFHGGLAQRPGYVGYSQIGLHDVIPHELGHNLSLRHAPGCGARGVDDDYPHVNGGLGPHRGWERNWRRFASTDEGYADIMSSCSHLDFPSDYHYRKATEYWLGTRSTGGDIVMQARGLSRWSPRSANQSPANAGRANPASNDTGGLALSGWIDASGVWRLTHAQSTEKGPRAPLPDGELTLILFGADGMELYREPLSVTAVSHGTEAAWAARTPIPPRPAREAVILNAQGVAVLREVLPVLE